MVMYAILLWLLGRGHGDLGHPQIWFLILVLLNLTVQFSTTQGELQEKRHGV